MKLLVTIVNKGNCKEVSDICEKYKINFQTIYTAKGTASSERLEMLSLSETEKEVIMSLISDKDVAPIMSELNDSFGFNQAGNGIAFTVKIDSIGSNTYKYLLEGLGGIESGK